MVTPKPRQVRVDDDLWREFGEAAAGIGTDRSKLLVHFMRRFVESMVPRTVVDSPGVRDG